MVSTEMTKEHFHFCIDLELFSMNMSNKMQTVVHRINLIGLILGTGNDKLYSLLGFGDPPGRVYPPCQLYIHSYFCLNNPSYTNMFNHYMYLEVEDRNGANPFVGHVLSDE